MAFALILTGAALGPMVPAIEAAPALRMLIHTFFLLAAAMEGMAMAVEGRLRMRGGGVGWWVVLFALAVLIAAFNAAYRFPAFLLAFQWLTVLLAFFVALNETENARRRMLLLSTLAASGLVVCLHGMHQLFVELPDANALFAQDRAAVLRSLNIPEAFAFDFGGRLEQSRVFSTFLLPNSLAGFIVLIFPACLGIYLEAQSRMPGFPSRLARLARGVFLLPFAGAILFTRSKGGWIVFALAAAIFCVWALGKGLWRWRARIIGVAAVAAALFAIAQSAGLLPPLGDYAGSYSVRAGYWRAAVQILHRHPVVGVGPGNFGDAYSSVKTTADQETRHAHNDLLEIAAETGVAGILAYGGFVIAFWRSVARRRGELLPAHGQAEADEFSAARILILSVVLFALEALCSGCFQAGRGFVGWTWVATLWLAWTLFVTTVMRRGVAVRARNSFATIGIAAGLIGFYIHSLGDLDHYVGGIFQTAWLLMAVLLSARLSAAKPEYGVDRPLAGMSRLAMGLGPILIALLLTYGYVLPIIEAQSLQDYARDPQAKLSPQDREELLLRAIHAAPGDARNYFLVSDKLLSQYQAGYRTSQQGTSVLSQALLVAERAAERNPQRAEFRTRLGILHELRWLDGQREDDLIGAYSAYQRGEELFPSNPDGPLNMGRLLDRMGRYEDAMGKYIRARRLSMDQYHITRKFKPAESRELDERINQLQAATTERKEPPALNFTLPRLLGLPGEAG